jgi:hypothetical protein
MSLPHFRELIPYVLAYGAEHTSIDSSSIRPWIAKRANLSEEALNELRPSGVGTRFHNLVSWALKVAGEEGLIEKVSSGFYRLTDEGRALLRTTGFAPAPSSNPAPYAYGLSQQKDPWFTEVATKRFETERAVEIRFVLPLLERLGYSEDDRSDGQSVSMKIGSKTKHGEADFVVYDGPVKSPDTSLMIIEAKAPGAKMSDALGQAISYQRELRTLVIMITDGNKLELWEHHPNKGDERIFYSDRANLGVSFSELQKHASRSSLSRRKLALVHGSCGIPEEGVAVLHTTRATVERPFRRRRR